MLSVSQAAQTVKTLVRQCLPTWATIQYIVKNNYFLFC